MLTWVIRAMLVAIALAAGGGHAAPGFTRVSVQDRVFLDVPENWVIQDADQRQAAKDAAKRIYGTEGKAASFSAQSTAQSPRALVRVTISKLDEPVTQAELAREVKANKAGVVKDFGDAFLEETKQPGGSKFRESIVKGPYFDVLPLGGKLAMSMSYARKSLVEVGKLQRVTQFHAPLGSHKAVVTISYEDGNAQLKALAERISSSVKIE